MVQIGEAKAGTKHKHSTVSRLNGSLDWRLERGIKASGSSSLDSLKAAAIFDMHML